MRKRTRKKKIWKNEMVNNHLIFMCKKTSDFGNKYKVDKKCEKVW